MAQIDNRYALGGTAARTGVAVDEGLRAYMLRVYNYMAAGIALTGVVAYIIFTYAVTSDPALAANTGGRILALRQGVYLTPLGQTLFNTPLMYVLIFAPLAFVFFLSWRISDDERKCGADCVLAVRSGHGRIAVLDLPALHGDVHHAGVLRDGGCLRRAQPLRLHDQEGPLRLGFVPDHGRVRHHHRRHRQHVPAVQRPAVRHLGDRRAGVRGPHRLRHAADQGRLLRAHVDGSALAKGAIMGALSLYLDFINMFTSLLSLFGSRE